MTSSFDRKRKLDIVGIYDTTDDAGAGAAADLPVNGQQQQHTTDSSVDANINPWTGRPYSARYRTILNTRRKLPVYQFKDELVEAVKQNQFVVVEGETGSGALIFIVIP
jgi:pre-mRNA-splicing factor ATP-dependent RNA helicase DHX15/PRP43